MGQVSLITSEFFYFSLTMHLFFGNHPFADFKRMNTKYYISAVLLACTTGTLLLYHGPGTYAQLHGEQQAGRGSRAGSGCETDRGYEADRQGM